MRKATLTSRQTHPSDSSHLFRRLDLDVLVTRFEPSLTVMPATITLTLCSGM